MAARPCIGSTPWGTSPRSTIREEHSMLRRSPFVLLTSLVGLCAFAAAGDPQPRLPRDNLLVYRGPDGKPVPVKTVEDWAKRRAETIRGMESVMGKLPGAAKRC